MREDWDNLIILDACRHDTFEEVYGSKVDYKISRGSSTPEFLIENFLGRKYLDTVYITANPFVDRLVKKSFYKVISVWKYEWDKEINTVRPEAVVRYAIKAEELYPNKRLIIHFIQPHIPFLTDPELTSNINFYERFKHIARGRRLYPIKDPWLRALRGEVDPDRVWKAYKRNLEIVLSHALTLANKLKGKTVITSDHGEAFDQIFFPFPMKIAGHPTGIHILPLIKVPWLVINKKRKEIYNDYNNYYKLKIKIQKIKSRLMGDGQQSV